MNWILIDDGSLPGAHNMEFDLRIAENCNNDETFLRFYRWSPYCISLGANQKFDEIDLELLDKMNYDVVKRPTGGRAIFHAEELTYSIIVPLTSGFSPKEIYQSVSQAISIGLTKYNIKLKDVALESVQPNFPEVLKQNTGGICFASTAKNELKFSGKKIVGSAQKKLKSVVLQHGSILCGTKHKELVDYLNLTDVQKAAVKQDLSEKTIEIETILQKKVDYNKLRKCLTLGFEEYFNIRFNNFKETVVN